MQDFEVIKSEEYVLHYSKHQKTLLLYSILENWTLKCVDIALHAHTSGDIESGGKNGKIVENKIY